MEKRGQDLLCPGIIELSNDIRIVGSFIVFPDIVIFKNLKNFETRGRTGNPPTRGTRPILTVFWRVTGRVRVD